MPPVVRTIAAILVLAVPGAVGAQGVAAADGYAGGLRHAPGGGVAAAYQQPVPAAESPTTPSAGASPAVTSSGDTSLLGEPETAAAESLPLPPQSERPPLPLAPPGQPADTEGDRGGFSSTVTVFGSLAVVLGVFFVVAWGLRRVAPAASTALPGEVFEILGRASTTGRQQVQLLRCGNKLLLVSVTQSGAETLTEITDPVEVDRLAGLCRQAQPNSTTAAFRQVFEQFAPRRPASGAVSDGASDTASLWGKGPQEETPSSGPRVTMVKDELEIRHV